MRAWANPLVRLGIVLGLFGASCDTSPRGRDAAAQTGQSIAEVTVRLDAANGATPAISVLAFRASIAGVSADEVLPAVDPLVVPPPAGAVCVRREVAGAARALGEKGGRVELDALTGLVVELDPDRVGGSHSILQPTARVYPNLASVVGGVVAEAGPVELNATPEALSLGDSGGALFRIPALPRLADLDGQPLPPSPRFSASRDLSLLVSGPARAAALVELRPYGATWALACPLVSQTGESDRVVIRASDLATLAELRVPVFIEAVARENHFVQLGPSVGGDVDGDGARSAPGRRGATIRLTLEVRTSSRVELVP